MIALIFRFISSIIEEIEENIQSSRLLENFKISEVPALQTKCIELVEMLVTFLY